MKIIARIRSDFPTKFGIPRQSGRVEELTACIVFEPEYRVREAVKGLEDFSHIWLLWEFSQSIRENWSPTVRPPRLGGNERMGVFATRSPFRPNPVGLSCVKLEKIDLESKEAPVLIVSGADLMDGTPIYDIKPYLPYADCIPEAKTGILGETPDKTEEVLFENIGPAEVQAGELEVIQEILSRNPPPAYQGDQERIYGMKYGRFEVKFRRVKEKIYVQSIESL